MNDQIQKLIYLASMDHVKSEDALRYSQAACNVAHALAATPKTSTEYLNAPAENAYIGFSREEASRRAQEVCRIAGETGQTVAAAEHLALLIPYIRHGYFHEGDPWDADQ